MGERLTGLYKAFDHTLGTYSIINKLKSENTIFFEESKKNLTELQENNKTLVLVSDQRDELMKGHLELNDIKEDLLNQKDKIQKAYKEKYISLSKELSLAIEEREFLKSKREESEKKFMDMSEEFKKYRQKMKVKYSNIQEKEEKFCKNCQKSYYENENYNWSCRVHASKLNGDMYWCCGKSGKDSIGCIISKHSSKEDADLIGGEVESVQQIRFCSVIFYLGLQRFWT